MAVTHPEHHQRLRDKQPQRGPSREGESPEQPGGPQRAGRIQRRTRKIAAPLLVFLALAGYFFWLASAMGGATPDGQTEMGAVFGAILLAVLALAGGAWLGRKLQ
jgi:hypothetical protein